MISDERKNRVKKIKNNKLSNTKQPYQHRILQVYINMTLRRDKNNTFTSNSIPFSLQDLRGNINKSDKTIHTYLNT